MTEQEMREAKVPRIRNILKLGWYVWKLVKRQHDYGTCVYAMSMAAVAAFNYVASKLGVTGFQASCADLDVLRRTRHMDAPFMIINLDKALYPQYDLQKQLREFIEENKEWLKEQAQKKLLEGDIAHPDVKRHWEDLIA